MIAVSPAIHQAGTIPDAYRVLPWRVIGRFNTIEAAEPLMYHLRSQGAEACLTLIGGLSVIARSGCSNATETPPMNADRHTQTDQHEPTSGRDSKIRGAVRPDTDSLEALAGTML